LVRTLRAIHGWQTTQNVSTLEQYETSVMLDSQRGSPDDQFINVDDCDELRHWAKVLQLTPDDLKAAVFRLGTSAEKIRKYLRSSDASLA
jgi:hypothetical protein